MNQNPLKCLFILQLDQNPQKKGEGNVQQAQWQDLPVLLFVHCIGYTMCAQNSLVLFDTGAMIKAQQRHHDLQRKE